MSNDEQQRSGRHDTLGEMSDVEQQRSRSAVDLRKSSTKCRSVKTTQLNSTSSDNVLSVAFLNRTRRKFAAASRFQRTRASGTFRGRSVDHSFARHMQARCASRHAV